MTVTATPRDGLVPIRSEPDTRNLPAVARGEANRLALREHGAMTQAVWHYHDLGRR